MSLAFHSPSRYNISGRLGIGAKLLVSGELGLFVLGSTVSGFPKKRWG